LKPLEQVVVLHARFLVYYSVQNFVDELVVQYCFYDVSRGVFVQVDFCVRRAIMGERGGLELEVLAVADG
jgi:hypothetical protein